MRGEKLEQPHTDMEQESPEAGKRETESEQSTEFAEGLEKDSRLEAIKSELIHQWEQSTGKDILSAEGQDFQFGDPAAWKRGQEAVTLEQRARAAFAERFPEDAQVYAEKEKTRVYDNPADDPAIQEVDRSIRRITNQDVRQMQAGTWGKAAAKEAGGMGNRDVWDRHSMRVTMEEWDNFLRVYPEKAVGYRDTFPDIKEAFERRERL